MARCRFLRPTSFRPSRVLSKRTNTTNASSSCCMSGGTSASPPVRMARAGFQGPRIPKRFPYLHQPSSLSCLSPPMRRYVLCVQSLAPVLHEPSGPGASPPSYSPTPHELHYLVQPSGPPPSTLAQVACVLSEHLRRVGRDTGSVLSNCPCPCIAHGIALSAKYGFQRLALFLHSQHALVAQSRRTAPPIWEWSRQAGVAVSLSETRSLSTHLRCFEYDHLRSVACRASTVRCTRLPQSSSG
jgi:hypothetical protein